MRCFSSLGLLEYSGIKVRLTTPPDLSQSSTPFSLLVPRHPPHALTSLAALFAPSLVSPLRSSQTLFPASVSLAYFGKQASKTMLPFSLSSKARVLSFADSIPPAPL